MIETNEHIRSFLRYYFQLPTAPEYAVLLTGKWGAGKTWFVERCLEELKEKSGKSLYVSLYGVTSFEGIENEFFRQLHPVLSSKGMALAGKFAKGLLKAAIKVDLDGHEATLSPGIPDIQLPDYLTNTADLVLVFDDVERCSIPTGDLLGYINHFVEHGGYKVVLVANEEEILECENVEEGKGDTVEGGGTSGRAYRRIKEKLIGKSFEVEPDLTASMESFLKQIASEGARKIFDENHQLIRNVYVSSTYKNLRHLRQALLDIERLLVLLPRSVQDKPDLLSHLIGTYLVYVFEIRNGSIRSAAIRDAPDSDFSQYFATSEERKKSDFGKLVDKYPFVELRRAILPPALWAQILDSGYIDTGAIEEALFNSRYFATDDRPDWVKLWHAFDLQDDAVEQLLAMVLERFKKHEYEELEQVRHIVGTLLWLSDAKVYGETRPAIVAAAKEYIDHLKSEKKLAPSSGIRSPFDDMSSAGLAYHEHASPEFKEVTAYLHEKRAEALRESYPGEAETLLELMKTDTNKFLRSLVLSNHEDNRFFKTPILAYISPARFVEQFIAITPEQRRTVGGTIEDRYKFHDHALSLRSEKDWLREVAGLLVLESHKREGKMSGYYFELMSGLFRQAADAIQAFEMDPA